MYIFKCVHIKRCKVVGLMIQEVIFLIVHVYILYLGSRTRAHTRNSALDVTDTSGRSFSYVLFLASLELEIRTQEVFLFFHAS